MAVLSDQEVDARLAGMGGWSRTEKSIRKTFECNDFVGSVDFVNRITPIAEAMNHHPDVEISWNKVTLQLSTHSESGLTENDFKLANSVDSVAPQ